jgi:protein SCO1/2
MKNIIIAGMLLLTTAVISCKTHTVATRPSCCEKASAMPDLSGSLPQADASIYQLPGSWTDQHGRTLSLNELRGKVRIVAMVFTHCTYACPRIVQDMKAIEEALPESEKKEVGYVLVSFDAERDNPERLAQYAGWQGLDEPWTLLHGSTDQVRQLSMLLNVRYQPTGNGNFNHTNAILILDKNGSILRSIEGLEPQTSLALNTIGNIVKR